MRRSLPWISGIALVAVAGVVTLAIPSDDSLTDPFLIRGSTDNELASRTLRIAVQDSTFADEVAVPASEWSAEGNWLVITVEASATQTETGAAINLATLTVDGRVFQASERPSDSLLRTPLHVGTALVGPLVFELPIDLRHGTAELRLSPTTPTPLLDDVIVITLPLDDLPTTSQVDLIAPEWATP